MSQTVSLDSVVAMFADSPNFTCTVTKQKGYSAYHLVVNCGVCGDRSSVSVICPVTGSDLTVSTRNHCCGDMFVGELPNHVQMSRRRS
jgi:hypothetical protein